MTDLISRQEAIDAFLTELTKRERENFLHTWSTVEVKYFVADMLEKLPSAQPGWIPTSVRLPEEDGQYLTTCKSFLAGYDYTDIFIFKSDIYDEYEPHRQEHKPGWLSYSDETGWFEMSNVTAWMLLPTPYREGGQS